MRTEFWWEFLWDLRKTLALSGTDNLGKEEKAKRWFCSPFIDEEYEYEQKCVAEKAAISIKTLCCISSLFV